MRRAPVKHVLGVTLLHLAVFGIVFAAVLLTASGCAKSPRAEADRLEVLYGSTVEELSDLREARVIDAGTYHDVITPVRKSARAGLDEAKAAIAVGEGDRATILLRSVNSALLKLQQYRESTKAKAATQPTSRPLTAGDPTGASLLIALSLLKLVNRIAPVAEKLLRGEELTPEEREAAEQYSAAADARADRLDVEAAGELRGA